MRGIIIIAALCLAGCAPRLSLANSAGGVIDKSGSIGSDRAYALATTHCEQFGKVPKITNRDILTNKLRFECVAP